jgi:hypothetical protein
MLNYRPILLVTTFSEVGENVMHNRLSNYLEANNILIPEQFGFRKGISTKSAPLKLTDGILKIT